MTYSVKFRERGIEMEENEDIIVDTINQNITTFIENLDKGKQIPYNLTTELKIAILDVYSAGILEGLSLCHTGNIISHKTIFLDRINDTLSRFKAGLIDLDNTWKEIVKDAKNYQKFKSFIQ
jgi:hypothetical protein